MTSLPSACGQCSDSPPADGRNLIDLRPRSTFARKRHDRDSRRRCDRERRRRPAVHLLLSHARFHPRDGPRVRLEQSPAARDAIAQILTNSRLCAEGHRPICQDTGIVVVFVKVGMGVRWQANARSRVDDQRRRATRVPGSATTSCAPRSSQIPACKRANTRDNTPAVIHTEFAPGDQRRDHGRGQGRRLGEQVDVRDAEPLRLGGRLGSGAWCPTWAPDGARPGCSAWASAAVRRRPCCSPRSR